MIPFSKPFIPAKSLTYLTEVFTSGRLSGDHSFTQKCHEYLERSIKAQKVLLTTSGTHALEMSALLLNLQTGDEVICPSFTFSSTANAFALRGAQLRFVDVDPVTMNITAQHIEQAITSKTKAICVVHYAGVACDMDPIIELGRLKNIPIIEDAAQAIGSEYKGKALGRMGLFGCLSFHETKNITCGEGGALIINDQENALRSEVIREKGTNRAQFFRGEIDKYSWRDIGSSYLPSDMNAAFLYSQLEEIDFIQAGRMNAWNRYAENLRSLSQKGFISLPQIPDYAKHNAHIYFIKLKNSEWRSKFMKFLKDHKIHTTFHYVPLHSSEAGLKYGNFIGIDRVTTLESSRLVRLPLFSELSVEECDLICQHIEDFFKTL